MMNPYKALIDLGITANFLHSAKREFSATEDALDTPQRNELEATFAAMLTAQYGAIDAKKILRGLDRANITSDDLLSLVRREMPNGRDEIDYEKALLLMLFFSGMGQSLGFEDAPNEPTGLEKIEAQQAGMRWATERLNALLDIGQRQPYTGRIQDAGLPHGLDETTQAAIVALILLALREAGDKATLAEIDERYKILVRDEIARRSGFIADDNAVTALSNGQFQAVQSLEDERPIAKKWLRTKSRLPRAEHLEQVGVIVPFNAVFPSGQFWSQELPNCKCGIEVIFDTGRSRRFGQ